MKILTQLFLAASTFLVQVFVPDSLEESSIKEAWPQTSPLLSHTQSENQIVYKDISYTFRYALIDKVANLQLINNLELGQSSQEVYQNSSCTHLINGNFYSENDTPIGWLLSQNKLESKYVQNKLFNGFLLINRSESALISTDPDDLNTARIGVQSGPLLITNYKLQQLRLNTDKPARRSLAFITDKKDLYFASVTTSDNQYTGPLLEELPQLVNSFAQTQNLKIESAINLDGGSASAFITPEHKQTEITKVGSFFCLQDE